MNPIANPLDAIIDFAESSGAFDLFTINNAKDELKRLRQEVDNFRRQLDKPVAWARLNGRGDLYDPRLCCNPYVDTREIVPLYGFKREKTNED